jgi:hypothetical protein
LDERKILPPFLLLFLRVDREGRDRECVLAEIARAADPEHGATGKIVVVEAQPGRHFRPFDSSKEGVTQVGGTQAQRS